MGEGGGDQQRRRNSCQNVYGGVNLVYINWGKLHRRTWNELFTDVFVFTLNVQVRNEQNVSTQNIPHLI